MRKLDIRYTAGIVDGEGCISIHINKAALQANLRPRVVMQLSVANTFKPLVEALKENYGGAIHTNRKIKKYPSKHKESYSWTLSEQAACQLLKRLRPYLVVKDRQADLAIELLGLKEQYRKRKGSRGGRQGCKLTDKEYAQRIDLAERCKALNRRGALHAPKG